MQLVIKNEKWRMKKESWGIFNGGYDLVNVGGL